MKANPVTSPLAFVCATAAAVTWPATFHKTLRAAEVDFSITEDTFLSPNSALGGPGAAHGGDTTLHVTGGVIIGGYSDYYAYALFKVDLTAYNGFNINGGTFNVYQVGGDERASTVSLVATGHAVAPTWTESQATWNNTARSTTDSLWSQQTLDGSSGWRSFAFNASAANFLEFYANPARPNNVGFMLKQYAGSNQPKTFGSRESANKPFLRLDVTPPPTTYNGYDPHGSWTVFEGGTFSPRALVSTSAYYKVTGRDLTFTSGDGQSSTRSGSVGAPTNGLDESVTFRYANDSNGAPLGYQITGTVDLDLANGLRGYAVTQTFNDTNTVKVLNVAPTIASATLNGAAGGITVDEGGTVSMRMTSTDPGADAHAFTIAGMAAGTDVNTSGTRVSQTLQTTFADDGSFPLEFKVTDDDTSTTLTRTVTVRNVAPVITRLGDLSVNWTREPLVLLSAGATDVGINDVLGYTWDFNGDGKADFVGNNAAFDFTGFPAGLYAGKLTVSDGDGGTATRSMNVAVVPEPAAVAAAGFAVAAVLATGPRTRGSARRRR